MTLLKPPSHWKYYLFAAFLIRLMLVGFFVYENQHNRNDMLVHGVVFKEYDYEYLLLPADNYFESGVYAYQQGKPFAGRMPGYSAPYMVLRLVLPQHAALVTLIVLQFALSVIATYIAALTAWLIFKSFGAFIIAFFLHLLAGYIYVFDNHTFSESFAASAVVFSLYFFVRYFESGKRSRDLVWSGLFLGWTIFLRSFTAVSLVIMGLGLWFREGGFRGGGRALKKTCLFVLPFVIMETAWIVRNYNTVGGFVPVQTDLYASYGKMYAPGMESLRSLIGAWGGQATYNEAGGEAWWFRNASDKDAAAYRFSPDIFKGVKTYNLDSLKALRQLVRKYTFSRDPVEQKRLDALILAKTAVYRTDFVSTNKSYYYLKRPLKLLKKLLLHSGTLHFPMPPFSKSNFFEKAFKLFNTFLYLMVLVGGSIAMAYFLVTTRYRFYALICTGCIAAVVLILVFYSPAQGPRYFLTCFPALLVFFSGFLARFFSRGLAAGINQSNK